MEDRTLDQPLTRGAEHLISPGDEAMRILTTEEFVEAQLAYVKANNLIHFPLAGETRDEAANSSIADALLASYIREPVMAEPIPYESDMAEPEIEAVSDQLEILQGFQEPVKEPWQMTRDEFDALYENTRQAINRQGAFLDVNALTRSQREVFLASSGGTRDLQYDSVKTRRMLVYRDIGCEFEAWGDARVKPHLNEGPVKRMVSDYLKVAQNQGRLVYHRLNVGTFVVDKGEASERAIQGCETGTADFLVLRYVESASREDNGGCEALYIETKRQGKKGKQSDAQIAFQARAEEQGARYELVRSLEDLERILLR